MAAEDGIEHIVATPHANERYYFDRDHMNEMLAHLRALSGGRPQLSLGCDFHLSYENIQSALNDPARYTIDGGKYMLVELSNFSVPMQINEAFTQLGDKGITPVITHPERNPILQRSPERVLAWVEQGCVVQMTASALTGFWGERVWHMAQWLLKRNAVHVLATDAHDTKHRVPKLSAGRDAVEEICGPDVARAMVDDNPRAIVNGEKLPYFPNIVAA